MACILWAAVTLTGCSLLPSFSDSGTVTDSEYVTRGRHLTVHKTDTRLTPLDNIDLLTADGHYCTSWFRVKEPHFQTIKCDVLWSGHRGKI